MLLSVHILTLCKALRKRLTASCHMCNVKEADEKYIKMGVGLELTLVTTFTDFIYAKREQEQKLENASVFCTIFY